MYDWHEQKWRWRGASAAPSAAEPAETPCFALAALPSNAVRVWDADAWAATCSEGYTGEIFWKWEYYLALECTESPQDFRGNLPYFIDLY